MFSLTRLTTSILLLIFSSLLYAEDVTSKTENQPHLQFLETSGLSSVIKLSPAIIDQEIKNIDRRKSGLSKKELSAFQNELLARYHPSELERISLRLFLQGQQADIKNIEALNEFFQNDASAALIGQIESIMLEENQQALIDYQQRITEQPPQDHRKRMARAYDGLNHVSQWQLMLRLQIQGDILKRVSLAGKPEAYQAEDPVNQLARLQGFNEIIYLYAFRQTPASEIVPILNFLSNDANQQIFISLDQAFEKCLKQRSELNLKLN